MKNLLTFGCSFTDNDEEKMVNGKYTEPHKTWPVELARLTNTNPICKGRGAAGNFYISNKIYETIDTSEFHWNNSVVMVMWSGIDRVDRAVSKEEFHLISERRDAVDDWLHSGGYNPIQKHWNNYYKTYHTEEDSYLKTLNYIIGVQEFLSNRNIPHLFLTYKDIFTDYYGKHKRAKNLENQVNWDKFHFPDLWCGGEFGGEYEWVRDNNLTYYEDKVHPSPESHRKFAEYLYNLDECIYLFK
tara:strand:- start:449 stop:1177 length:729 start_codon:yes stop_codon:yes gene_type:complete